MSHPHRCQLLRFRTRHRCWTPCRRSNPSSTNLDAGHLAASPTPYHQPTSLPTTILSINTVQRTVPVIPSALHPTTTQLSQQGASTTPTSTLSHRHQLPRSTSLTALKTTLRPSPYQPSSLPSHPHHHRHSELSQTTNPLASEHATHA